MSIIKTIKSSQHAPTTGGPIRPTLFPANWINAVPAFALAALPIWVAVTEVF